MILVYSDVTDVHADMHKEKITLSTRAYVVRA